MLALHRRRRVLSPRLLAALRRPLSQAAPSLAARVLELSEAKPTAASISPAPQPAAMILPHQCA